MILKPEANISMILHYNEKKGINLDGILRILVSRLTILFQLAIYNNDTSSILEILNLKIKCCRTIICEKRDEIIEEVVTGKIIIR